MEIKKSILPFIQQHPSLTYYALLPLLHFVIGSTITSIISMIALRMVPQGTPSTAGIANLGLVTMTIPFVFLLMLVILCTITWKLSQNKQTTVLSALMYVAMSIILPSMYAFVVGMMIAIGLVAIPR